MKITKEKLRQVIKEELDATLNEFSQNSPIVKKKGKFDYGEKGGLEGLTAHHMAQLDDAVKGLIDQNDNPETAIKTMERFGNETGVSIPFGLALWIIGLKHDASGTEEGNKAWNAYKNNIEGKTADGNVFRALDYLSIGGGADNREKLEELYPQLFAEMAKKDQPYR
tara:strand:+ start:352 stop:852 length:501 start_codon:yes stop_codon:yes gene_type:complete